MSFKPPYADAQQGDFVYGVYAGTPTMVALQALGCCRLSAKYTDANTAYDTMYKGPVPGNHLIKRMSKVGLNLFVQNHITVHFVLDQLKMDTVPTKSYNAEDKNPDSRSITGAELRWIYRHRDHLDVQAHIQFWYKNQQCPPPWVDDSLTNYSANWVLYKPKNTDTVMAPDVSHVKVQRPLAPSSIPAAVPVPAKKKTCNCCVVM